MAVKYGRRGGVSGNNKDWKSYYGAAYDTFVETQRRDRELRAKEREENRKRIKAVEDAIEKNPELREIYEAEYYQDREDELAGYGDCDYDYDCD